MKTNISIILVFFALFISFLDAQASVTIKDIEYLKGEDFVQLHFVTDKIISIPDVYYPDENNTRRLVMRISDVRFDIARDRFQFDSPVIEQVSIRKNSKYLDVEIGLKTKVNYRVFTNQKGLFIEFPDVGKIPAQAIARGVKAQPQKKTEVSSSQPSKQVTKKTLPVTGKNNTIQDVRIAVKNEKKIKFEFVMDRATDYKVIPIPEKPARLAIDLLGTRSPNLSKQINHLDVNKLRGARNTASKYRLVFDLKELKSYSVSLNKNVLEVEFYNTQALANNNLKAQSSEQKKTMPPPLVQEKPKLELKVDKENSPQIVLAENKVAAPVKNEEEFFSEEKSQIDATPLKIKEKREDPPVKETQSGMGAIFQRETIDAGETEWTGELRSYHLKDQDLQNLLLLLAKDTGLSMVFDPDISGKVTAELNFVPWDQALDIFLRQNGLDMVREGNVVRIGRVDKLAQEAKNRRQLKDSKKQEADLSTYTRGLNYAKASDVKKILDKSLSPRGNIIFDERSNTLVISEVPSNINVLDGLIRVLDMPNPQVAIEARIVETNSNFTENLGVQWGPNFIADAAHGNQTTLAFPNNIQAIGNQLISDKSPFLGPAGGYAVNLPASGATSGMVFSLGNVANTFRLDMALSAMQIEGKGRIIQAPRLVTQNNMESSVSQGNKIPVQTLQNNTIQVRYVDAVLQLKVTPTITADDTITMTIEIKNDNADFANLVGGIPPMTTQSAKTTVRCQNGSTVVIGGMYKIEKATTNEGVPLLRKIPLLGNLFKNSSKRGVQRETLIFITPRIVK